jgi:hypothetical protein
LADEWADADELGVVFGVFGGDLGGEWHGDTVSEKIFVGDGKWTEGGIETLCRAYGAGDWSCSCSHPFRGGLNSFAPTALVICFAMGGAGMNGAGSGAGAS